MGWKTISKSCWVHQKIRAAPSGFHPPWLLFPQNSASLSLFCHDEILPSGHWAGCLCGPPKLHTFRRRTCKDGPRSLMSPEVHGECKGNYAKKKAYFRWVKYGIHMMHDMYGIFINMSSPFTPKMTQMGVNIPYMEQIDGTVVDGQRHSSRSLNVLIFSSCVGLFEALTSQHSRVQHKTPARKHKKTTRNMLKPPV